MFGNVEILKITLKYNFIKKIIIVFKSLFISLWWEKAVFCIGALCKKKATWELLISDFCICMIIKYYKASDYEYELLVNKETFSIWNLIKKMGQSTSCNAHCNCKENGQEVSRDTM